MRLRTSQVTRLRLLPAFVCAAAVSLIFTQAPEGGIRDPMEPRSLGTDGDWSQLHVGISLPPPRWGHTAIHDTLNHRVVVFGGADFSIGANPSPRYSDVWALSLDGPTYQWAQLVPTGPLPAGRWEHTAIYDSKRFRMIVFAGEDSESDQLNDTWAFNMTTAGQPEWQQLTPLGALPPIRDGHVAVYDVVGDRMIAFSGGPLLLNDTWELSFTTSPHGQWTQLNPPGAPSARTTATAVYDPVRRRMLVFGGSSFGSDETWSLSLGNTPAWSLLNPAPPLPEPRVWASSIYEPTRDRMVIFGGWLRQTPFEPFANDIWELLLGGFDWNELAPTGTLPTERIESTTVYHPSWKRMVLFAGQEGPPDYELMNDTWQLAWAPPPQGGGGCPYWFGWSGFDFELDNNLLPASEFLTGEPGFFNDHYMLNQRLAITESGYQAEIRELESDVSTLDCLKLRRVDHSPDLRIAVDTSGEILLYRD